MFLIQVRLASLALVLKIISSQCSPSAPNIVNPVNTPVWSVPLTGQIGLDPPTMTVVPGGALPEAILGLANCSAVAVPMRCDLRAGLLQCTIYSPQAGGDGAPAAAAAAYSAFLSGKPLEVPLKGFGKGSGVGSGAAEGFSRGGAGDGCGSGGEGEDEEVWGPWDSYLRPPEMERSWMPLTTFAVVGALPRGALVEVGFCSGIILCNSTRTAAGRF